MCVSEFDTKFSFVKFVCMMAPYNVMSHELRGHVAVPEHAS